MVGTRILLLASYGDEQKWIAKAWPAVAPSVVWSYAEQYDAQTTLWCQQFANPFAENKTDNLRNI